MKKLCFLTLFAVVFFVVPSAQAQYCAAKAPLAGSPDQCPGDDLKTAPGTCGCGFPDTDTDGDGVMDCNDGCPEDASKTSGPCGSDSLATCIVDCSVDSLACCAGASDCSNCGVSPGPREKVIDFNGKCDCVCQYDLC